MLTLFLPQEVEIELIFTLQAAVYQLQQFWPLISLIN